MSEGGGALREIAARFGIEFDDKELAKGVQSIGGAIDRLKEFGQLLAANELVQRVREFADQFEEQAGRIDDTAQTLGVTTDELQALGYAAEQGGLNAEQATAAWATLNRSIAAAAQGSGAQADAFRALGVAVKSADGSTRPLVDVTMDAARALGSMTDPARRAALAQQVFGEGGRRLLTIMKDGEGGVAALAREFGELGGALSQESIEAAGAYGDEMNRLRVAQDGLRATLATALLPILTGVAQKTREWMVTIGGMLRQSEAAKAALLVLGAVAAAVAIKVLIAWAPVLLPIAKLALIVIALVAVFDELITTANGGDSMIRRFIDGMLGVGATRNMVIALGEAWEGIKRILSDLAPLGDLIAQAWGLSFQVAMLPFRGIMWIGQQAFGIWRRLFSWISDQYARVARFAAPLLERLGLGDVAQRLSASLELGPNASRALENLTDPQQWAALASPLEGIANEWRRTVFNVGPTGVATARVPGAAARPVVTNNVTAPVNITVNGAGEPAAVAREVERRQRDAQQAAMRATAGALVRGAERPRGDR